MTADEDADVFVGFSFGGGDELHGGEELLAEGESTVPIRVRNLNKIRQLFFFFHTHFQRHFTV